jgi:hypothetical protein
MMSNESKLEEASKIAREAKFAALGRAIADAAMAGAEVSRLTDEAERMRRHELEMIDKQTQFAALVRQVGDAHSKHRELADLLYKLIDLRRKELGPA